MLGSAALKRGVLTHLVHPTAGVLCFVGVARDFFRACPAALALLNSLTPIQDAADLSRATLSTLIRGLL